MILLWMGYVIAIGLVIRAAAVVAERGARALDLPIRALWVAACVATFVWPIASYVVASHRPAAHSSWYGPIGGGSMESPIRQRPASVPSLWSRMSARVAAAESATSVLDRPLMIAWALASLLILARLAVSMYRLRTRRRGWRQTDLDGTGVLISNDIGPAVVGLREMQIVVPQWLLDLDEPLRAIVLRHEEEHRAAGDPLLLFAAAVACAVTPWNLVLWWQARRLRLAVEIDCDARVLREGPRVDRYGALLMAIAQRRVADVPIAAAALTEPVSDLERRIEAMTTPSKRSRIVGLSCGAAVAVVIALACAAPSPDAVGGPTAARAAVVPEPHVVRDSASGTSSLAKPGSASVQPTRPATVIADRSVYIESQVDKPVMVAEGNRPPAYPAKLRVANTEGEVMVSFVVDTLGNADTTTFKVIRSTDSLFTAAVREKLPSFRFLAAEKGGKKVEQVVQMPFVFSLNK